MGAADEVLNADWPYPSIIDGTDFFVRHPPFGPNGNIAPYHLSALFDRAKAISLDFYRADILSSDFESLYRLMIGTKIGFVDEVAAVWRQHDNNATRQVQHEQLRDNLRLFQSLFEYASKTELGGLIDLRAWLRRRLARAWLGHSIELVRRNWAPLQVLTLAHAVGKIDPMFWRAVPSAVVDCANEWRHARRASKVAGS